MAARAERPLGRSGRIALGGLVVAGSVLAQADPFTLVFFVSYAAVGALLVLRRPYNAIGWLMLAISFGFVGTTSPPGLDVMALQTGTASTRDVVAAWFGGWSGSASYLCFLALAIVFPSGQLPSGRWRTPAAAVIAAGVALVVLTASAPTLAINPDGGAARLVIPNPFAVLPSLPFWSLLSPDATFLLIIAALLFVGLGASLVRYRRSTGIVRLQLRWLASAVVFVIVAGAFGLGTIGVFGDEMGLLGWIPVIVAYPTLPLAIGIAVMRYRLFEIDRIISRTLAYAVVTAVLAIVFAGVVLGLQAVLSAFTQRNTLAVAISTLVVAALFQPMRAVVQRAADRRFNRSRYDADRTVEGFAANLRDEVDLERLRGELQTVVGRSLAPASVGVWLRLSDRTGGR